MHFTNYLIVSNVSLIIFYGAYLLFKKNETQFSFLRFTLLGGTILALILPLLNISAWFSWIGSGYSTNQNFLSDWVPEIVITPQDIPTIVVTPQNGITLWQWVQWIYMGVAALLFIRLAVNIILILRLKSKSISYRWQGLTVCEVDNESVAFTFFKTIFLAKDSSLSALEIEQVVKHESIHANSFHSLDTIFIRILRVVFWFNPVLIHIEKSLHQLHEFEADHKCIENESADHYIDLLVRSVMMQSGISVISHFSKSETLKRIAMIQKTKHNISGWKMATLLPAFLVLIIFISCQDQIMKEISKSTVSQTSDYPPEVKTAMAALQAAYPNEKLSYVEGTEEDIDKLVNESGKMYWVKKVYVFKPDAHSVVKGAILSNVANHADGLKMDGDVFAIVEEPASPLNGMKEFYQFIAENIRYPLEAKKAGVEGKVYVRFLVDTDGNLSGFNVVQGIGMDCDEEAVRVLSMSPPWKPGKQKGIAVKSTFSLPIIFKLDGSVFNHSTSAVDKPPTENGAALKDFGVTSNEPAYKELAASDQYPVIKTGSTHSGAIALPPNGMEAFNKFIADNLKYPEAAIKANVEGSVKVALTINEYGKLTDFKLIRGIGMGCDEEAIRVLKQSPDWLPAILNGQPVPSTFNLAIVFALNNHGQLDELNSSGNVQQKSERHEFVKRGSHRQELKLGNYVIGAVFSKEEHAQQLTEELKKLEYSEIDYGYASTKRRWYVYLVMRNEIEAARMERDKYRQLNIFKDAWLLTVQD